MGRVAVIVSLLLTLFPRVANADSCEHDFGLASAEAFVMMMNVQNLAINGTSTPPRLVGLAAPHGGQALVGGGLAAQIRCDYVMWDLASLRVAQAVSGGLGGTTSLDGSVASVGLSPLRLVEIGLPLFGVPSGFQLFPSFNWKVAFKLEWGMEYLGADATITGAATRGAEGSIDDWDFFARTQLATCRRLSNVEAVSTRWGCLTITPVLYEKAWFSAVSFGLRVDL